MSQTGLLFHLELAPYASQEAMVAASIARQTSRHSRSAPLALVADYTREAQDAAERSAVAADKARDAMRTALRCQRLLSARVKESHADMVTSTQRHVRAARRMAAKAQSHAADAGDLDKPDVTIQHFGNGERVTTYGKRNRAGWHGLRKQLQDAAANA